MARAIGAPPQAVVWLDDTVLDAQSCADSQVRNTGHMIERFTEVFADGCVDERDEAAVRDLLRHTRLEAQLNEDQVSLLKWTRRHLERVTELVAQYRARLQEMKKAALASGLNTSATQE